MVAPVPAASPASARPRLVIVGATYTTLETRKKIGFLAEDFDLVCITGQSYTGYGIENRLADQPTPTNYRLVGLPTLGDPRTTTRYLFRGLGRELARHRADVILVETEPWAFIRWQTWFWKTLRQPRALFGEFSWENVARRGWKGAILAAFYRLAVATDDFVVAGNLEAGQFFRAGGLSAEQLLVAPQLGIDETVFRPLPGDERDRLRATMDAGPEDFLVGFCGRMDQQKGVLDLLEAVEGARGRQAGGRGQIKLALLGPPGPLTERLTAFQTAHPWLRLYPARPHAEIAGFMQALDLFVLPSRTQDDGQTTWKEQFGHVLIEAMSCGVPILGSDCGAIPEVLGAAEQVFPEGDVRVLTTRLLDWQGDPAQRTEIVRRQNVRLAGNYTNKVLAKRWANFILARLAAVEARS